MKGFVWNADSVRLYRAALEVTRFQESIAAEVLPFLNPADTVLDAGCGLGGLSLAIAPHVKQVYAVDTDRRALAELSEDIRRRSVPNITVSEGDVFSYTPPTCADVLVCCAFGRTGEILQLAKRLGVRTVIWIKKDYTEHRFSKGVHPIGSESFLLCTEALTALGIPFTAHRFAVEAGQPLKDTEDARLFFTIYGKDGDPSVYTDEFLNSRVVPSDDPRYPLYLPHQRRLGLIVFHGKDIPSEISFP
ncbi:MAG: methyltransferase domain-containing protein [Clostridia bacterium]|nr:methyltransferase domain-containing protein [Clostridia bacterium]